MLKLYEDWEFNVLGVYNYTQPGPHDVLYDFIRTHHDRLPGDIVEAGVYRGKSLLGMAMLLKSLGSTKKVYGYDSFSGFPSGNDPRDDLERFEEMASQGLIAPAHLEKVRRNRQWRTHLSNQTQTARTLSSSGDFSDTSRAPVEKKIALLGLDNIVLVDGLFSATMTPQASEPRVVMAALMDCDLYASYIDTFRFVWPRLATGGMIYLDEYYSLKFPGARLATRDFFADKPEQADLRMAPLKPGDFERWSVVKT